MLIFVQKSNTNYLFLTFIAVYAFAMGLFVNKVSKEEIASFGHTSYFIAEATNKK